MPEKALTMGSYLYITIVINSKSILDNNNNNKYLAFNLDNKLYFDNDVLSLAIQYLENSPQINDIRIIIYLTDKLPNINTLGRKEVEDLKRFLDKASSILENSLILLTAKPAYKKEILDFKKIIEGLKFQWEN